MRKQAQRGDGGGRGGEARLPGSNHSFTQWPSEPQPPASFCLTPMLAAFVLHHQEGLPPASRRGWGVGTAPVPAQGNPAPSGPPPALPLQERPCQPALKAPEASTEGKQTETEWPELSPGRRREMFSQLPPFLDTAPALDPVSGMTGRSGAQAFKDGSLCYARRRLFP